MNAQPLADATSDHLKVVSMHRLILRASHELDMDPALRREVLLNLVRSLQEDRRQGGPSPIKAS